MMKCNTILVIMPRDKRQALLEQLEGCGNRVLAVSNCDQARQVFRAGVPVQVVLTDSELPDGNWCTVLDEVTHSQTNAEVIVCARLADARFWCDALDRGAYDLLVEPFHREEVRRIVRGAEARGQVRMQAA